ncbi:MAG: SIS domain-containing protein [Kiritimatiellae bacterium]|nr:SIS domain-containing protein [Kiritimatiellia bacterium]
MDNAVKDAVAPDLITQYTDIVTKTMETIAGEERENIRKAAELLSDKVAEGRLINIYGAGGHSAIGAMEIFWRAGGLVFPHRVCKGAGALM